MAPSTTSGPAAARDRMFSSVEMPPEATTGNPATLATERYASTSMPVCMPSRAISVNTRCLNPSEASSDTTSSQLRPTPSRQPLTLTCPSRAATSATSNSPNPRAATSANPGSVTKTVPRAMRLAPAAASWSMRARERTPPPTSIDSPSMEPNRANRAHVRGACVVVFAERRGEVDDVDPARARLREFACNGNGVVGIDLHAAAVARSRRTTLPSIRSMAGKRITRGLLGRGWMMRCGRGGVRRRGMRCGRCEEV